MKIDHQIKIKNKKIYICQVDLVLNIMGTCTSIYRTITYAFTSRINEMLLLCRVGTWDNNKVRDADI